MSSLPFWLRINQNYSMQPTDQGISVDTTSGNITVQTPVIQSMKSDRIAFKKLTADVNTVTVQCTDGENIDGNSSYTISAQNGVVELIPDATTNSWIVVSKI